MTTNLTELERLLAEATPLPWDYELTDGKTYYRLIHKNAGGWQNNLGHVHVRGGTPNVKLIAAAVNALPDLIKRVRDAEEKVTGYEKYFAEFKRIQLGGVIK